MNMAVAHALLQVPEQVAGRETENGCEFSFSPQLRAYFDKSQGAIWSRWSPSPRPCFNPRLLADIRAYHDFLSGTGGKIEVGAEDHAINYVVMASDMPRVFSLGGDLDLFKMLIGRQDRAGLLYYGRACIDVLHRNYVSHELPATTISLVQGECLGGGFEAALSNDVIIAEKKLTLRLPRDTVQPLPGHGCLLVPGSQGRTEACRAAHHQRTPLLGRGDARHGRRRHGSRGRRGRCRCILLHFVPAAYQGRALRSRGRAPASPWNRLC